MKITILTAFWKRPDVLKIFLRSIELLRESEDVDLVAVGSERDLIPEWATFVRFKNMPLSDKWNVGLQNCKDADYVIILGSDDIIDISLLKEMIKRMKKGIDFIYLTDFYLYDIRSRSGMYWGGYVSERKGEGGGVGRCISKRVLQILDYQLWPNGLPKGLDAGMMDRLYYLKHTKEAISLKETDSFGIDLKGEDNLTKFWLWKNAQPIRIKRELFKGLKDELCTAILKLRG